MGSEMCIRDSSLSFSPLPLSLSFSLSLATPQAQEARVPVDVALELALPLIQEGLRQGRHRENMLGGEPQRRLSCGDLLGREPGGEWQSRGSDECEIRKQELKSRNVHPRARAVASALQRARGLPFAHEWARVGSRRAAVRVWSKSKVDSPHPALKKTGASSEVWKSRGIAWTHGFCVCGKTCAMIQT